MLDVKSTPGEDTRMSGREFVERREDLRARLAVVEDKAEQMFGLLYGNGQPALTEKLRMEITLAIADLRKDIEEERHTGIAQHTMIKRRLAKLEIAGVVVITLAAVTLVLLTRNPALLKELLSLL